MKTLRDITVQDKRVLLRVDFNVGVHDGEVEDDFRIRAALPTLEYLLQHGASVILLSHLGRPKGPQEELSLRPVGEHLANLLGRDVRFFATYQQAQQEAPTLRVGDVALLENLRFEMGEEEASEAYARRLAELGEVYVNDAFAVSHRRHASVFVLPQVMSEAVAGFLLEREKEVFDELRNNAKRPVVFLMGGAKVASKVRVVGALLERVDALCFGGVLANSILAAQGGAIGRSKYEDGEVAEYIHSLKLDDTKALLPIDVVTSPDMTGEKGIRVKLTESVQADEMILDIGPQTIELFSHKIHEARTVFWNGPMGLFEVASFANGTNELIKALQETKAKVIVGGGDIISALDAKQARGAASYISTGGGAMLEYLADGTLPGIEVLEG